MSEKRITLHWDDLRNSAVMERIPADVAEEDHRVEIDETEAARHVYLDRWDGSRTEFSEMEQSHPRLMTILRDAGQFR